MPFDALGILKGHYGGALIDMDESDAAAVAVAANSDGNCVVDIRKTGSKGLAAVMVVTEGPDADAYSDESTIEVQASDELDRNWLTVATFPVLHHFLRVMKKCTATTGFVALDATTPRVLTATTDTATGLIVSFDEALKEIGGVGDIVIEMQDDADLYATAGDTLTATSGTGVATQGAAAIAGPQMTPGIHVVRFKTEKRYVRVKCTCADRVGKTWILLTDWAAQGV